MGVSRSGFGMSSRWGQEVLGDPTDQTVCIHIYQSAILCAHAISGRIKMMQENLDVINGFGVPAQQFVDHLKRVYSCAQRSPLMESVGAGDFESDIGVNNRSSSAMLPEEELIAEIKRRSGIDLESLEIEEKARVLSEGSLYIDSEHTLDGHLSLACISAGKASAGRGAVDPDIDPLLYPELIDPEWEGDPDDEPWYYDHSMFMGSYGDNMETLQDGQEPCLTTYGTWPRGDGHNSYFTTGRLVNNIKQLSVAQRILFDQNHAMGRVIDIILGELVKLCLAMNAAIPMLAEGISATRGYDPDGERIGGPDDFTWESALPSQGGWRIYYTNLPTYTQFKIPPYRWRGMNKEAQTQIVSENAGGGKSPIVDDEIYNSPLDTVNFINLPIGAYTHLVGDANINSPGVVSRILFPGGKSLVQIYRDHGGERQSVGGFRSFDWWAAKALNYLADEGTGGVEVFGDAVSQLASTDKALVNIPISIQGKMRELLESRISELGDIRDSEASSIFGDKAGEMKEIILNCRMVFGSVNAISSSGFDTGTGPASTNIINYGSLTPTGFELYEKKIKENTKEEISDIILLNYIYKWLEEYEEQKCLQKMYLSLGHTVQLGPASLRATGLHRVSVGSGWSSGDAPGQASTISMWQSIASSCP